MPESFRYPEQSTALWLPLGFDPAHPNSTNFSFRAVARLRPGVQVATAVAELDHYLPRLLDEFPTEIPPEMWAQAHIRAVVKPLRDVVVGDTSRLLWILLGAVALLLLIACANVASLCMVRAEGAQRDLAIRVALGAGGGAVLTQYLVEALLLAAGGGALGILLAGLAIGALHATPDAIDLPRLAEVGIDARVVLFALGIATISAIAASLMPVLRARRVSPGIVLKESSRSATVGRDRQRARSALVVGQVALALVLVAGSTLMARSFAQLRSVRPGFDPRGVITLRVALPQATYADGAARLRFFDRLLQAVSALPGVRNAAVTDWLPLSNDHNDSVVSIEDHPLPEGSIPPDHPLSYVSPGYFAALGIPLLTGRTFAPLDATRPSTEVIASRAFVTRYWKNESAIGKRVRKSLNGPWYTIIGVTGDVHLQSLERPAEEVLYFPLITPDGSQSSVPGAVAIAIRTAGDPSALMPSLRAVIHALDPALPTYDERPMTARLAASAARTRFVMLMLGIASAVALLIGMVGLYGVLAYSVTLRRREIGVRMALGASARNVTGMIARRGISLAALGIGVGLCGAVALTRVLHGLLFGVSPTDPVALIGTCITLLAVAIIASLLPAWRASGINPMEALRQD